MMFRHTPLNYQANLLPHSKNQLAPIGMILQICPVTGPGKPGGCRFFLDVPGKGGYPND